MSSAFGTCKWFNMKKGFGFISTDYGTDVFVNHREIQMEGFKMLKPGQECSFIVVEEDGKMKATAVFPSDKIHKPETTKPEVPTPEAPAESEKPKKAPKKAKAKPEPPAPEPPKAEAPPAETDTPKKASKKSKKPGSARNS